MSLADVAQRSTPTIGAARLRLAVIGPSGAGKSTCAGLIERFANGAGLTVTKVPLATPLYALQAQVYASTGVTLRQGAQDQLLMESLADHLRRIDPDAIVADFLRRLATTSADVVINDDLRDPHVDAPILRRNGFRVLRITCDESVRQARLGRRGDPTLADRSTAQINLIDPDAVVDNSGDLDAYQRNLDAVLREWL